MVSDFSFSAELEQVQTQLKDEIFFKAASFDELVKLRLDNFDQILCPALVLAGTKIASQINIQTIEMAKTIQFTFLADKVHHLMHDGEMSEDDRQFPVLVGDFLYGKFFLGLSKHDLLKYLAPIANIIREMSVGIILRWDLSTKTTEEELPAWLEIYQKERGALTALSAKIGAELGGASSEVIQKCEEFGLRIGLTWAAMNSGYNQQTLYKLLEQAKDVIDSLTNVNADPLYEVYEYFENHLRRTS